MEIFYLCFCAHHLLKALFVSTVRKDLVMTWWMQCCTELLLFIGVTDNMGKRVQVIFVASLVLSCTISLALDDAGAYDFLCAIVCPVQALHGQHCYFIQNSIFVLC